MPQAQTLDYKATALKTERKGFTDIICILKQISFSFTTTKETPYTIAI